MEKMTIGKLGEIAVREYLVQQGCFVVQCNYHAAGGHHEEIDIIACDGKHLIFTEVKSRKEGAMVAAQLALTPQKRRRVLLCAQRFLMNHTSFACYQPRFDVACVTFRGRQDWSTIQMPFLCTIPLCKAVDRIHTNDVERNEGL